MGSDTEENGEAGDDCEADPELAEVARGAPDHAERLVLLLATVLDAHWERAALVVGVGNRAAVGGGDLENTKFTSGRETVGDDVVLVDDVRDPRDEPGRAARVSTVSKS